MKTFLKSLALAAVLASAGAAGAAPTGTAKWLVLDKITYQTGVDRIAFEGIDSLLLTKLAQSKYKVLDRDAYDTAAREQGFGANVELVPAGYSIRGEIVEVARSGKSRAIGGTNKDEYIATVSIRINDLRTQEAYEADTIRVTQYVQTPKDMLVYVVKRMALAILMRDYPPKLIDYDEDDSTLTVNYGGDFLNVGEQYEVRRRKEIVDEDTGETVYKEKTVGVCEITDVAPKTANAVLISGKAKLKDVLRLYEGAADIPPVPTQSTTVPPPPKAAPGEISATPGVLPRKVPRIAVAPFISKRNSVGVWGWSIATRTWMDDVADHLNMTLTQCGSFRALDRNFGPEIDRELGRIVNDPNANPDDVVRLSRKLATDYLVVAEVVFSDVASPGVDFATGLPLPPPSAIFAEVRYRCIMAPTTEMVVADVVKIDASHFGGTMENFSSTSAQAAADAIRQTIQRRLDAAGFSAYEAARMASVPGPDEVLLDQASLRQKAMQDAQIRTDISPSDVRNMPAPVPVRPRGINIGF